MMTLNDSPPPSALLEQLHELAALLEQEQALLQQTAIDELHVMMDKRQELLAGIAAWQDTIADALSPSNTAPPSPWPEIADMLKWCRELNASNHQLTRIGLRTVEQSLGLMQELVRGYAGETYDGQGSTLPSETRRRDIGMA